MRPTRCSLRNLEEMTAERGVIVDHATVHRWSLKILPVLAKVFRSRQRSVGSSWRMDETYIKVGGSVALRASGQARANAAFEDQMASE